MGCGAAEATGLGFVCFVVLNPHVLSANRVDLGFSCFIKFPILHPSIGEAQRAGRVVQSKDLLTPKVGLFNKW